MPMQPDVSQPKPQPARTEQKILNCSNPVPGADIHMAAMTNQTVRPTDTDASRRLRRYWRWYGWVFLAVILVGFAVVNAFWGFLATGRWMNFSVGAYRSALTTPVGKMLQYPLDVFTHPWMIAVTGLLLGLVIVVPLVVAVLNRLLVAAVFILVVAVLGQAPVLALVIALGVMLAGRTSLRFEAPFLAILLGLAPVVLYLLAAAYAGEDSAALLPLQRWVRNVPFLIAIVSGVLVSAGVVGLGHVTGYRPFVVWPVLTLLLVVPIWIFYDRIGEDELSYALIVSDLAPGDAVFRPARLQRWRSRPDAKGLNPRTLRIRIEDDLRSRRDKLAGSCEVFVRQYPHSARAAAVLWIRAQCCSLRLDRRALTAGQVSYTAKYPLPGSAEAWRRVRSRFRASPQAALAQWRLASLALRKQQMQVADDLLHSAAEMLGDYVTGPDWRRSSDWTANTFGRADSVPGDEYYAEALFEIERQLWLIEQNDLLNDQAAARAMADYMSIDPNRADYAEQLMALLDDPERKYEKTKMGDNLKLAVARANPNVFERAAMLVSLAGELTDAAIEANYELGRLVMSEPVLRLEGAIESSASYFKRVKQAPPNPYAKLAGTKLARLDAAKTDTKP